MNKLINGNPRWQDVEELALRFLMINESNSYDKPVEMSNGSVNREKNFCGSSACHAGWYAVYSDEYSVKDFYDGVELISNLLGFKCPYVRYAGLIHTMPLCSWANNNPLLWGNKFGGSMFQIKKPFGAESGVKITLKDISKHWMGVAGRLWEIQQ